MPFYYKKNVVSLELETKAFQFERDEPPDWFNEAVNDGKIIIGETEDGIVLFSTIQMDSPPRGALLTALPGDWILQEKSGELCVIREEHLFQKAD